ncbi:MAG: hypothetical protein R3250_13485, partial [Melioribacteraceae bacterium]|nr:hypothetical protein [Melioribacteraceae bacterium]
MAYGINILRSNKSLAGRYITNPSAKHKLSSSKYSTEKRGVLSFIYRLTGLSTSYNTAISRKISPLYRHILFSITFLVLFVGNTFGQITIICPTDITVSCATSVPAAATTVAAFNALPGASVSSACGNITNISSSDNIINQTCPNQYTIQRTYTATDDCGSPAASCTQVITVNDNSPPFLIGSLPITTVEGCDASDIPAAVNTVAALEALGLTISDNCSSDASMTVTSSDGAPSGNCPIVIVRTYTITDECGNSSNT